jgi:hypothetical protein
MLEIKDFRKHKGLTSAQQEELETRQYKTSQEGRVPCASCIAIEKSLGIPTAEVGKTANKLNIIISKCQLSCF